MRPHTSKESGKEGGEGAACLPKPPSRDLMLLSEKLRERAGPTAKQRMSSRTEELAVGWGDLAIVLILRVVQASRDRDWATLVSVGWER